jgi:hypothetical protein
LAGSDFLLPPAQQSACRVPLAAEVFGPLLLALEYACPPALKFEFLSFDFFSFEFLCGLLYDEVGIFLIYQNKKLSFLF